MGEQLFSERFFRRVGLLTVYSTFFLIFVGGLVRVTGSGMGCPDWPKCFDQWVPPTDVSELPDDYRTRFAAPGKPVAEFSVYHTWTEYVNRLVGVFIGLVVFLTMISSWQYRKKAPRITVYAVLSFLLVGFQGWIGKVVVDKNLAGWMVTIHMLLALVVVALLMLAVYRKERPLIHHEYQGELRNLSFILLGLTLIQISIGTQVRERVDEVFLLHEASDWVNHAGALLKSHIFLSVLVLGLTVVLYLRGRKTLKASPKIYQALQLTCWVTVLQILTGILNRWMEFPAYAQVLHILLGTIMAGGSFYMGMLLSRTPANAEPV